MDLSVSCLKGEEWDGFVETKTNETSSSLNKNKAPSSSTPKTPAPDDMENPPHAEPSSETEESQSEAETCPK